jgi:hypothetical protein
LPLRAVKINRATQPIGDIRKVNQRRREMSFFDFGVQVSLLAAPDGLNEVLPGAATLNLTWTGSLLFAEKTL